MRRSADQQQIDDLARRRLDALIAELGGRPDGPDEARAARGPGSVWDEPLPRGRHAHRPLSITSRLVGWLDDRLPEPLRGRVRLGTAQLGVVALLLAAGVLWAAWTTTRSGDDGGVPAAPVVTSPSTLVATAPATSAPSGGTSAPLVSPAVGAGGAAGAAASELVVDVQGTVRRPGIVVLPVGSRVVDAVEAAGGYTGRPRRLAPVNLARPLVDGEQVLVGTSAPPAAGVPGAAGAAGGSSAPSGGLVSLNSADQAALETLPGVGPVTAAAILQWRDEHGPFTAVDQLLEVSGIGEKTLAQIAPFVTL